MKNILLLFFTIFTSIVLSQSSVQKFQGIWEFESMTIVTDSTSFIEPYHATNLVVEGEKFIMGLSEASSFGEIRIEQGISTFVFNRMYFPEGYGEEMWRDLTVIYADDHLLKLTMTNVSTLSFTTSVSGFVDIVFTYHR